MTDRLTIKTERRGPGRWYWLCEDLGGTWRGPFGTEALAVANANQQTRDYLRDGEKHRRADTKRKQTEWRRRRKELQAQFGKTHWSKF